jgi:hypothetical protein
MASIYQPRRPRASPLWQVVHTAWDDFLTGYERHHRPAMGPLRPESVTAVQAYYRCGDLTTGFTRYLCPDCGHERLLAFTCKARHICPACHQRRTRQTAEWIATHVCHPVPHRQFVFTIPKVLRGIFRKRRRLLTHLFQTATACLRDHFRTRLNLPKGRLAAAAALHTFGDYLVYHPHLHILASDGLFDEEGRFHCMPSGEDLTPLTDLFRARFLHALHSAKLISQAKLADLLSWKHSGFHVHADPAPVGPRDLKGRQRLAEYLLRAPFSLQKIHWNPVTQTVIYRSRRSWNTKRNFEVFPATDFLAAVIEHIPPKSQHTIRYYGLYSNKSRGMARPAVQPIVPHPEKSESPAENEQKAPPPETDPLLIPPPPASAQAMKPLWRDLILATWGADPLQCPCCKGTMRRVETLIQPEKIEFFLRLMGMWEGLINIPPPPDPPFDIETFEPIEPPWHAIKQWIPADDDEVVAGGSDPGWAAHHSNESPWKPKEVLLDEDRILVLDAD